MSNRRRKERIEVLKVALALHGVRVYDMGAAAGTTWVSYEWQGHKWTTRGKNPDAALERLLQQVEGTPNPGVS